MKTNILILAAGQAPFEQHDDGYPLCLAELKGISVLERIVNNTKNITLAQYCFAILESDAERYHLDKVATLLVPGAHVIRIPESTKGSACTAILAASQLPSDNELLIISANEFVDQDFSHIIDYFNDRNLDGGTLIFQSIHPRYSFVRLSDDGLVVETSQRNPISRNATAGVFWFKRTRDFVEAAKCSIRKDASVSGAFYVAPTFNELILDQKKIGVYALEPEKYHPLKTESQLHKFEHRGK